MSTELYRKYIDIINENSKENTQLNEGMVDSIKNLLPKFMKMLGSEAATIADKVKQTTGGDFSLSKENIQKVIKGLGLENLKNQSTNEGIAGNWQGKLIQALYSLGLIGSAAGAFSDPGPFAGPALFGVALLLLMFAQVFFGSAPGQIGAMGKFGNKGFSAKQGNSSDI